jgi:hypothetical protein
MEFGLFLRTRSIFPTSSVRYTLLAPLRTRISKRRRRISSVLSFLNKILNVEKYLIKIKDGTLFENWLMAQPLLKKAGYRINESLSVAVDEVASAALPERFVEELQYPCDAKESIPDDDFDQRVGREEPPLQESNQLISKRQKKRRLQQMAALHKVILNSLISYIFSLTILLISI